MIAVYMIRAFVYLILLQGETWGLTLPQKEMVVYPTLLEGRDADGRKMLKITDDLTLNLESSSVFSDNFLLITTMDDGQTVKENVNAEEYEENLYHDNDNMASLMVTQDMGAVRVDGIIAETLRIKPLLGSERSSEGHIAHLVSRIAMRKPFAPRMSERSGDSNQGNHTGTDRPEANDHQQSNGSAVDYVHAPPTTDDQPEENGITEDYTEPPPSEGVTVDSALGVQRSSASVVEERADEVMYVETHIVVEKTHAKKFDYKQNKIISYLATLTNAVNLRYSLMKKPRVKVLIVGVTIQKGKEPYLARNSDNPKVIEPMKTVMELDTYMRKKEEYGRADFIMLITCLDIGSYEGDSTSGFTMFATVCGQYKTGSFEDEPDTYDATYIFAHELAHGLGVVHDGDGPDRDVKNHPGASKCRYDAGNIMGEYSFKLAHYRFSDCSVKQIQNTYSLKDKYKCLHEKNREKTIKSSDKYPGDIISLDTMCKIDLKRFNRDYGYDQEKGVTDCEINCIAKERSGYTYYAQARALDGHKCDSKDSKKACFNGKCVDSTKYKKLIQKKKNKS
ncbi:A disintegrin and metalloproteinase with thrombospondin motifs like [Ornithodoros turicata]|uniref:A disintegrin and metalloproteinase with thrombospondin motifs like n=1 Tax=Ornithodoros turicata TaxID=34597 RepID=UPI003139D720